MGQLIIKNDILDDFEFTLQYSYSFEIKNTPTYIYIFIILQIVKNEVISRAKLFTVF